MTRMWMLDPSKMCKQHLVGEHSELHMLVGTINKGRFKVVAGHARKLQIDTTKIISRHDELVHEMKTRGMNHHSPLPYFDPLDIGDVDTEANLIDLCSRCPECAKGFNFDIRLKRIIVPEPPPEPEKPLEKKWYALKVYPDKETAIRKKIYREAFLRDLEDLVGKILIPAEKVTEIKNGVRKTSKQKKFPGYLICEVAWCGDTFHLFRDIDGVGNFVNSEGVPVPLKDEEVKHLLLEERAANNKPTKETPDSRMKIQIPYSVGDGAIVKYGPYKDVEGVVKEIIDHETMPKTVIVIEVLGTAVNIELEHWMVTKL